MPDALLAAIARAAWVWTRGYSDGRRTPGSPRRRDNAAVRLRVFALISMLGAAAPAAAADVWTTPHPGVRYLHRSSTGPKEIHALVVDLSRPEITLRATRESEKGRTTTSFAGLAGAVAAVNGDFYASGFDPIGLAIGEGAVWSTDSGSHRFIACTATNDCEIEATAGTRAADSSWRSAVGGNVLLVNNGNVVQTAANDSACGSFCTTPHPRTAAGLSMDGDTLLLVVVEGRQGALTGLSTTRLAELMLDLGAHVALNLDGGGSSAMVVDGVRVSGRPTNEPAERRVANHLAILHAPAMATTGRLVGFIREDDIFDDTAGLRGATVMLSSGESATTDDRGFYAIDDVAAGAVTVMASLPGFVTASDTKDVMAGITNWKSIALSRVPPDAGVGPDAAAPDAGQVDAGLASDAGLADDVGVAGDASARDAGAVDAAALGDAATQVADAAAVDAAILVTATPDEGCSCAARPDAPSGLTVGTLALLGLVALRRRSAGPRIGGARGSRVIAPGRSGGFSTCRARGRTRR